MSRRNGVRILQFKYKSCVGAPELAVCQPCTRSLASTPNGPASNTEVVNFVFTLSCVCFQHKVGQFGRLFRYLDTLSSASTPKPKEYIWSLLPPLRFACSNISIVQESDTSQLAIYKTTLHQHQNLRILNFVLATLSSPRHLNLQKHRTQRVTLQQPATYTTIRGNRASSFSFHQHYHNAGAINFTSAR